MSGVSLKGRKSEELRKLVGVHPMFLLLSPHSRVPLLVGGVRCSRPACGPPASISVHLASSTVTPAGSVHKSRGDNVVHMWVQLKRLCVSCVSVLQRGHSGDVCDLGSTLCKYDLRKWLYLF